MSAKLNKPKTTSLTDSLLVIEGDEFMHDAAVQYITQPEMRARIAKTLARGFEPSSVRTKPELAVPISALESAPAAFVDVAMAWRCCEQPHDCDHPGGAIIEVKTGRLRIGNILRQTAAYRALERLGDAFGAAFAGLDGRLLCALASPTLAHPDEVRALNQHDISFIHLDDGFSEYWRDRQVNR